MTTAETTGTDEAVGTALPSEEELDELTAATLAALEQQPSMQLLDPESAQWHGMDGPGRHLLTIEPATTGTLDVGLRRFVPDLPEAITELLVARMAATVGAAPVAGGAAAHVVDWPALRILTETDGVLTASATTVPDDAGVIHELTLAFDVTLTPTVIAANPVGGNADAVVAASAEAAAELVAEAESILEDTETDDDTDADTDEIDGAYLGNHYGDSEFTFDGKDFVIDWSTWDTDQTTEDGLVGSAAKATSGGDTYDVYAWFDPDEGIEIVGATPTGEGGTDADGDADNPDPDHGITADYLGDYYGTDPLEFEGHAIVVDWTTWAPDQVTDEGLVGSPATGTDENGVRQDLYIWFDPAEGAQIASAEAGDAPGAGDQIDPRQHFDTVLSVELREVWSGNGGRLTDTAGKEYDVGGWLGGDSECEPELVGFDGEAFRLLMTMSTVEDEPQRVRCALRVVDARTVTVENEEPA